jgi:hypothetical protein
MYRDYAVNERLFHWQSQSTTSAGVADRLRYAAHAVLGYTPLLFAREHRDRNGCPSRSPSSARPATWATPEPSDEHQLGVGPSVAARLYGHSHGWPWPDRERRSDLRLGREPTRSRPPASTPIVVSQTRVGRVGPKHARDLGFPVSTRFLRLTCRAVVRDHSLVRPVSETGPYFSQIWISRDGVAVRRPALSELILRGSVGASPKPAHSRRRSRVEPGCRWWQYGWE